MNEYPKKPQPQDLDLAGQNIHFWRGGTGPALLLIHSAWGDAEMSWSSVWDQISGSFTVIAPDIPGFGRSSPISQPTLSAMAGAFKKLLDASHIDRAIVMGNSFGAAVAVRFAADFPEATTRLVLVNGGYMPVLPDVVRKVIAWPRVNRMFRRLMLHLSFSSQTLKKSFVNPSQLPSGFLEIIRGNSSVNSPVVFDTFMNITRALPVPEMPTYLIWGAGDGLTPLKQAKALQKKMPGTMLISIEGAGHMPQVERPREFVMAVMSIGKNAG